MLNTKLFEIRDRATYIPVVATKLVSTDEIEAKHLRKLGFSNQILLTPLNGGKAQYAPYQWDDRTYTVAHEYIETHFDFIPTGYIVDVEYILGETYKPKESDV